MRIFTEALVTKVKKLAPGIAKGHEIWLIQWNGEADISGFNTTCNCRSKN